MRFIIKRLSSNYRKCFLVISFSFLFIGFTTGQESWSMDQFMLTSSSNAVVNYQNEKLNLITSDNYRLPLVERLEFRTETHDFDLEKQEYALRLSTNSLGEINAAKDILKSEKELARIHQEVILKNEMMNRYNIIISLVFLQDDLELINKELALYSAKKNVLKTMATWDLVEIKDLIKTEEDFQEADIERISIENALEAVRSKISEICGNEVVLNTEDLIAPRFIREHYQEILGQDSINNSDVEALDVEMEQILLKQTAARENKNKLVRYYQINYDGRNKPFEQEQLSIGVGFLLPVGGSEQRKITELKYDELELKSDYESAVQTMRLDRRDVLVDLKNNINQYELMKDHYDQSLAKKTLDKYKEIPEISALSVLSLKEFDMAQKRKLLESEFDLYLDYLKSIEVFDLVNPDAFQNYLSIRHFGY